MFVEPNGTKRNFFISPNPFVLLYGDGGTFPVIFEPDQYVHSFNVRP